MGFQSGSLAFRRFQVAGGSPGSIDEALVEKIKGHALEVNDLAKPEDIEYGWAGPRHILDKDFGFENIVFGDMLLLGLRTDTNRVPAAVKQARIAVEEAAVAANNPSGFLSKAQKAEIKRSMASAFDQELREGKYRKSSITQVIWDVANGYVYAMVSGTAYERLAELFNRTFDLVLVEETASTIAESAGVSLDGMTPTDFAEGTNPEPASYPWAAKSGSNTNFLGNEFLLWVMHEIEDKGGTFQTQQGDAKDDVSVLIERSLILDCTYGTNGKDTFTADGPTKLPEVRSAIRHGKVPRKAGLTVVVAGEEYGLTFNPEQFVFAGVKLPKVEKADTRRDEFIHRMDFVNTLCNGISNLFKAFLLERKDEAGWVVKSEEITKWLATEVSTAAAVAEPAGDDNDAE